MKCYYQAQDKQCFQASLLKLVEHTSMSYKLVTIQIGHSICIKHLRYIVFLSLFDCHHNPYLGIVSIRFSGTVYCTQAQFASHSYTIGCHTQHIPHLYTG